MICQSQYLVIDKQQQTKQAITRGKKYVESSNVFKTNPPLLSILMMMFYP